MQNKNNARLSRVTQDYLSTFYCILDEMIQGMTCAPLTDSISHNFIVQMIPHHQAAIEMCENLLKYTTNIPLQNVADCIIAEQTQSIQNMRQIQDCCSRQCNSDQALCQYQQRMDQIIQTMFTQMEQAPSGNSVNSNFIREMIPHHLGAIRMARTTLQCDICPELKPILRAIITSQEQGIRQMQQIFRQIGNCGC